MGSPDLESCVARMPKINLSVSGNEISIHNHAWYNWPCRTRGGWPHLYRENVELHFSGTRCTCLIKYSSWSWNWWDMTWPTDGTCTHLGWKWCLPCTILDFKSRSVIPKNSGCVSKLGSQEKNNWVPKRKMVTVMKTYENLGSQKNRTSPILWPG
jgi:hypothetical protein